jgi:hypothetical protein
MRRCAPSSGRWSRRAGCSCRSGRLQSPRRLGTRTTLGRALLVRGSAQSTGQRAATRSRTSSRCVSDCPGRRRRTSGLLILSQEQVSTAGLSDDKSNGSGLGDIEIGLTKRAFGDRFRSRLAGLGASVDRDRRERVRDWQRRARDRSGFRAVSARLMVVKSRRAPGVFRQPVLHGQPSGQQIRSGDQPGRYHWSFAWNILAAGPGTSLRSGLGLCFSRQNRGRRPRRSRLRRRQRRARARRRCGFAIQRG